MNRGSSLRFDTNRNYRTTVFEVSVRRPSCQDPELSPTDLLNNLRKHISPLKKRRRLDHKTVRDSTSRLGTTDDNVPASKEPPKARPATNAFRISPRLKKIVGGKRSSYLSNNPSDPDAPSYFMGELEEALSKPTSQHPLTECYHDYIAEMTEATNMSCHIKVELMKPINLPKKTKHTHTVILDLDETLVHCVFGSSERDATVLVQTNGESVETGLNLRPNTQKFLCEIAQMAEIVVWTASQANYADAAINLIDPQGKLVSHRLYRDHCTFSHGVHLKDLRRLNRPLEQVVIVDNSVYCFLLQLENGVPVLPYYEGSNDNQLLKLLDYLRQLLREADVRTSNSNYFQLKKYRQRPPTSKNFR